MNERPPLSSLAPYLPPPADLSRLTDGELAAHCEAMGWRYADGCADHVWRLLFEAAERLWRIDAAVKMARDEALEDAANIAERFSGWGPEWNNCTAHVSKEIRALIE